MAKEGRGKNKKKTESHTKSLKINEKETEDVMF